MFFFWRGSLTKKGERPPRLPPARHRPSRHPNTSHPCFAHPQAIVGNKADLPPAARAVSRDEGAALAREYGVPFFEASAKTGAGVDDAFTHVAREVVARAAAAPGGAWPPVSAGGGGVRLNSGGGAAARAKAACCGS